MLVALLLLAGGLAGAAEVAVTDPPDADPPPSVVDARAEIDIDGHLDEEDWTRAEPVTDFMRFQPVEGDEPPGRTEVRFLQDDRYLYVGVSVRDNDYPIRARISRREDINADDQVGVYLDTFRDGRTGYIFYFNGRGVQQDIRVGPGFSSFSWDTVLKTGGQVHDDGFTLEVAIPWRSLKYPRTDGDTPQTWGLILTRKIPAEGAKYSYPRTERAHPRLFTQAAPLRAVRPPPRGSGLEIVPSLTLVQQATRTGADGDPDPDAPLRWVDLDPDREGATGRWLRVVRPSLDTRIGITPNLGVAATLNPDFSQVDQDPTFINLNQRFAFFLPERRPFFLDGTEYFADQHDTLYSRSVVDPLYGVKLSGRAGAWSLGALHALDRNPAPSVHERPTPGFEEEDVEDAIALNDVVRARVDAFGDGYVGTSVADKRIIDRDGTVRGSHTAAGLDVRVPLDDRWTFDARTLQTLTGPEPTDLTWGQELGASLSRAGGIGAGMYANVTDVTQGYRRETGFLNQSGITYANAGASYTFEPEGILDTLTPNLGVSGRMERNSENQQSVSAGLDLRANGIHAIGTSVGYGRVEEGLGIDEEVDGKAIGKERVAGPFASASYYAELGRVFALNTSVSANRTMEFATLDPADTVVASSTITLRPTPGLRLDTTLRADQLTRPRTEDPEARRARANLLRHWTTWQFTKELGLRSMVEWSGGNERDDRLVTTVLLTWLENPGTAVHLGWIERTLLEGAPKTQDRSVFLKASVLFRP